MQTVTVENPVSIPELHEMSQKMFQKIVKAVVDVEEEIMVIDAEMHADQEAFLLDQGSKQENLWGINLHTDKFGLDELIEWNAIMNIRPSWGNRSRGVDDPMVQKRIRALVARLLACPPELKA